MYLHVAVGASLVLIRLVMERRGTGRGKVHGGRMALQAHRVDVVAGKQARVRRSVRRMARGTALRLDGRVLVDERPQGVDVALGADRVLGRIYVEQVSLE